jgi:hypothetical protein
MGTKQRAPFAFSVSRFQMLTTYQGLKYSEERIQAIKAAAALKHEVFMDDCVAAFVMLAKNTSMTGMRIQVDAGLNIQSA